MTASTAGAATHPERLGEYVALREHCDVRGLRDEMHTNSDRTTVELHRVLAHLWEVV